jgi:AraC family transcriptional regulator, transcriptional activator of pobA
VRSAALDDAELRCAMPLLRGDAPTPFALGPEHPAASRVAAALETVEREFEDREPGFELFAKAALIASLGELYRASSGAVRASHGAMGDSSRVRSRDRGSRPIAALLRRLCSDYMEPISVEEAASECALSKGYFCHAFKKSTGKTLVEYVQTLRVIEAEHLLAYTNLSVHEIANDVGFEDPAYFGRVFKSISGKSPRGARGGRGGVT